MAYTVLQASDILKQSHRRNTTLLKRDESRSQTYAPSTQNNNNNNNNNTVKHAKRRKTKQRDIISKPPQTETLCASLKFQDSEFLTSFNDLKFEKKYGDYVLSELEIPRKVLLIGDAGVGKSTYVRQYISRIFDAQNIWTAGGIYVLKFYLCDFCFRIFKSLVVGCSSYIPYSVLVLLTPYF